MPAHGDTCGRLRRAVQLPRKSSDPCGVVRLIANHRPSTSSKSTPEARVLPSTGITRLHQYYDPLRLPPGAHRRVYGTHAPPQWVSHVTRIPLRRAMPTTPADRTAAVDTFCHPYCLPRSWRVAIPNCTFEACSGFTRVMAHRIARPPKAVFVTRLRHHQFSGDAARQLPVLSTSLRAEPSSTGHACPRGTPGCARSNEMTIVA